MGKALLKRLEEALKFLLNSLPLLFREEVFLLDGVDCSVISRLLGRLLGVEGHGCLGTLFGVHALQLPQELLVACGQLGHYLFAGLILLSKVSFYLE